MIILERDVMYIVLSVYLLTLIHRQPLLNRNQHRHHNHIELELDFAKYTLMCRLRIFAWPPIYHLPGNVMSATVGLVCINLQPEYELPSSTRFGQSQKVRKNMSWGHCPPSHPEGKHFCTGSHQESPQRVQDDAIGFYWYYCLLVINCTRGHIVQRFRVIPFDMSNITIFGYPSCV